MGYQQRCTARYAGAVSPGKVRLDPQELTFEGTFKLVIPLPTIEVVAVEGSELSVTVPSGVAVFDLGSTAARWAQRLRRGPSRMDRLGIYAGMKVWAIHVQDATLLAEIRQRCGTVNDTQRDRLVDVILVGVTQPGELARVERIQWDLALRGVLWVIAPEGRPELSGAEVLTRGTTARYIARQSIDLDVALRAYSFVHAPDLVRALLLRGGRRAPRPTKRS